MQNHFIPDVVMLNISKMLNNKAFIFLSLSIFLSISAQATASIKCNSEHEQHIKRNVFDVICSHLIGDIYLKYDIKKRSILLESKDTRIAHHRLLILEKNADSRLVNEERSISFVTRQPVNIKGKEYIGLTLAERSMRGNGGGQCGAGSEIYFIALVISNTKITEQNRFLISSCKEDIYLANDGSKNDTSITVDAEQNVKFKWLTYRQNNNSVTGNYDFEKNKFTISE